RFADEARAAARLTHPNVVTIYEVGTEGDTPFIAMELVEGRSLRELLDGGSPGMKKSLSIGAQIADALAAAHAAGVVHRDLKPENVLVGMDGRVRILDFGLAKTSPPLGSAAESTISWETLHTRPGVVLGTIGYM